MAQWTSCNGHADAADQAVILSMCPHSDISPSGQALRDQHFRPRSGRMAPLGEMVSTRVPHWRGAQAQWPFKGDFRLLQMTTPSDGSSGVLSLGDQPSCHPTTPFNKNVFTGGPHWRGAHDQWLVKRLSSVPVAVVVMLIVVYIIHLHAYKLAAPIKFVIWPAFVARILTPRGTIKKHFF